MDPSQTAEALLAAWLPGGIAGVYAICLGKDIFDGMDSRLRAHFPSMAHYPAVDCRTSLRTPDDFARLRFPVTNAVMFNILLGLSQKQDRDIVTPGPVGVSQSHLSIWADNAHRAGWIVIFESDAAVGPQFGADIADIVRTPMVEPLPGVIKLGWTLHPHGGISSAPVSPFVNLVLGGMHFGMQAYAIRCDALGAYIRLLAPIGAHIDHEITDLAATGLSLPLWSVAKNACTQVNTAKGSIHPKFSFRLLLPESNSAANTLMLLPWVLLLVAIVVAAVVGATCRKSRE
jgi:hypothetical protein